MRASLLCIFLAANQPLSYGCNNKMGLYKAHSRKLVEANQFISGKSQNNVIAIKSSFTVCIHNAFIHCGA